MLRRAFAFIWDLLQQADMVLLGLCTGASLFGCVMIYSATHYTGSVRNVIVQLAALALGIVVYVLMSVLDLGEAVKKWKWILGGSLVLILLLKTPLGIEAGGNVAWLRFPGFPVDLSVAEVVKITFILLLARQLTRLQEERGLRSISSIAMLGGHIALIGGLYYVVSGDMGSVLVFVFIFACMCFVAGVPKGWFVGGLLAGSFAFYVLWETDKINDYMKERFMILFDHELDPQGAGWQQTRSLLALGGGKLTGQGFLNGTQTQSENAWSLPARHTDFIFSAIGEELGTIGCLLTLLLLTAIVARCVLTARTAQDRMDIYICTGVAAMLIFQIVSNVGMCLYVMPVIGLTLPFISYGGSSLVMLFAAMGMVSGIQKRSRPEWLR